MNPPDNKNFAYSGEFTLTEIYIGYSVQNVLYFMISFVYMYLFDNVSVFSLFIFII